MADQQASTEVKTIVVPKALEEFFAPRLEARYAARGDVRVVVDRRQSERRVAAGPRPQPTPHHRATRTGRLVEPARPAVPDQLAPPADTADETRAGRLRRPALVS